MSVTGEELEMMPTRISSGMNSMTDQAHRTELDARTSHGRFYVYVLIAALICIDVSLFRIGERRINYPLVIGALMLLLPQTFTGIMQWRRLSSPTLVIVPLAASLAFCLFTTIWSAARSETLFHSGILIMGMMAVAGGARFKAEETARIFVVVASVVFVLSWMALVLAPGYALQEKGIWRLRGIMVHEFELGFLATATLVILSVYWLNPAQMGRRLGGWLYALALLAAVTLLATQTRTLLVYTLLILAIVGIFYTRGSRRLLILIAAIAAIFVGLAFIDEIMNAFSRGEGDASLSGRTTIWARTIGLANEVALRGYGFGSFTDPRFDFVWYRYRPAHAHNSWVMAYFETGYIGVALMTALVVAQLYVGAKLSRRLKRPSIGFLLTILCTLVGLTSMTYGGKLASLVSVTTLILLQEYAQSYPRTPRKSKPALGWVTPQVRA